VTSRAVITAVALVALTVTAGASRPLSRGDGSVLLGARTGVERFHYSITGRVRPMLFWISRAAVGDAVITRRRAPGEVGYSLLIGSDPERAPWGLNRWGYIEEEIHGGAARLIGLMVESDEDSVAQAQASVEKRSSNGHTFKIIQATVDQETANSVITSIVCSDDYNMRQARAVLDLALQERAGEARALKLPRGTRPGFLAAVAELMHLQAEQQRSTSRANSDKPLTLTFVYHGRIHQLRQTHVKDIPNLRIGNVSYGRAVTAEFTMTDSIDSEPTRFSMTYGTEGMFAEVPLTISYQPHWWIQIDLAIDTVADGHSLLDGSLQ
jgi:hypothetical protein